MFINVFKFHKSEKKNICHYDEQVECLHFQLNLFRFKKPKKKIKKLRKKLKAEDLEPLPTDSDSLDHRRRDPNRHLSDVLDTDDMNMSDFKEEIKVEEEDNELEHILSKVSRNTHEFGDGNENLEMVTRKCY